MAVEGIIAIGVTEILKKLSSVVANEITLVWDFNDELQNLQTTLNMILAVMEDAEKKQWSSMIVRLWMEDLKSIAYDAEDVLDEYYYEVILSKRENEEEHKSTVFNKVRTIFSSSKPASFVASSKLAHKVKKINEKFNNIAKRKNALELQTIDVGSSSSSSYALMMNNRETVSFVPYWKIIGRENDRSTIIKMLLEEENSSNNEGGGGKHVSVISIVGMGGLGKTTIAQLVCTDQAVNMHFDIKLWIGVSGPFDIKKLWKNIANSIGIAKQHDDAMADIARRLQDALRGKKFILVLDDVWNVDSAEWYKFKNPFMVGREGSKILVTTRNENIAFIMVDKYQPYRLCILTVNDSWSLFKEIAFGSAAGAEETPKLEEIGKEMVKRCGGLPLAVIFLGSLMRSKKKEEEWKIIRDTRLWHESREGGNFEILPSLRSSYNNLPSHLKLCFSYCCLFPIDWKIKRERLIRLWMAEGFIETPEENTMSMEEIGNEYFHSLLSYFFFQDVEKDEDGDVWSCKMHDLVHDFALSVVGNHECLIVENVHDIDCISEETRRLNLMVNLGDEEILAKVLEALKKAKKLRTIFVNKQRIRFDIGNAFKENKRLRVLDLGGSDVTTQSTYSSIGGLKHLRYLDVEEACFPKGMIGRLSFLQTLKEFNLGGKQQKKNKNASSVIEELEGLNLLTGDLSINNLQNVTSGIDACRANLKEKNHLGVLKLFWYGRYANNNDEAVLEGLRPHPNLRILEINGFEGAKLPRWIEDAGFGALLSLRSLTLNGLYKLKCLTIAFPSLKNLILEDMQSLKEWVVRSPSTTSIEEINIRNCPRLSIITPTTTIFPSLKVLNLEGIDGRAAETLVTNNLNSLTSLRLFEIKKLVSLPHQGLMENNNTLLSLHIEDCPQFKGFLRRLPNKEDEDNEEDDDQEGGGQQLQQKISQVVSSSSCSSSSSLQSLKLYGCPALRYYPNIRSLTSLRALEIQECKESQSLLTCLSSSSSSSFSSLEHLKYVQIVKNKTAAAVVYEWKKSEFLKD